MEIRPALAGHAGIPQETRLLFRGLSLIDDFAVEGLIQHATHALGPGLPPGGRTWLGPLSADRQIDRMARIVIMVEQKFLRSYLSLVPLLARRLVGWRERLRIFDATRFRDFIWRRFFARTLPTEDFEVVTRGRFRVARAPWNAQHICALVTRKLGWTLFPLLDTSDFDLMICEWPYPGIVSRRTRMVVRYHDAIPLLMPHTIAKRRFHQMFHYHSLRSNVRCGAWFVCVSEATRRDLVSVFPQVEARSVTIHNIVSHHYFDEPSDAARVPEIVKIRLNPRIKPPLDPSFRHRLFEGGVLRAPVHYLLMVATVEPRKNHLTLLAAWESLRAERFPDLRMLIVGELGWRQKRIVAKLRPWMERGDVFLLSDVPAPELRLLYKHARATVCPSFGEGFDFPGVEAMMSGGAVVASDIAVHREIYVDAAEYFNPYSAADLARAIARVVEPSQSEHRAELVSRGAAVAQRYGYDAVLPKWREFLLSVARGAA
jgi:hypothetical protein